MSAQDVVAAWIAERDAALEADGKGLDHSPGPSITAGSWNGSGTGPADLRREAQLLRFLARALDEDAEVEAAKAAAAVAEPEQGVTIHACPPSRGERVTPCCGVSPFNLPLTDCLTLVPALVTCRGPV